MFNVWIFQGLWKFLKTFTLRVFISFQYQNIKVSFFSRIMSKHQLRFSQTVYELDTIYKTIYNANTGEFVETCDEVGRQMLYVYMRKYIIPVPGTHDLLTTTNPLGEGRGHLDRYLFMCGANIVVVPFYETPKRYTEDEDFKEYLRFKQKYITKNGLDYLKDLFEDHRVQRELFRAFDYEMKYTKKLKKEFRKHNLVYV